MTTVFKSAGHDFAEVYSNSELCKENAAWMDKLAEEGRASHKPLKCAPARGRGVLRWGAAEAAERRAGARRGGWVACAAGWLGNGPVRPACSRLRAKQRLIRRPTNQRN